DVKESIEVGSGLVEEVVVGTVKEPFEVESRLVVHRKEGNGWFENQITETSDKSKMDSGTTILTTFPNDIMGLSPATCRWGYLSSATCRRGNIAGEGS
nr:hypothetical protein [Tanacetum cinerariifolium]